MTEDLGAAAGPDRRRRKPPAEREKELFDVAAEVFAEKGYQATRLRDIADRMGMLHGSLYHYISSKDELLVRLLSELYLGGSENLEKVMASEGTGAQRLEAALQGHVEYLLDNFTRSRLYLTQIWMLPKHVVDQVLGGRPSYLDRLRDLIKEGQADGSIRRDIRASVIMHTISGAINSVYQWYHPRPNSAEQVAHDIAALLIEGTRNRDTNV